MKAFHLSIMGEKIVYINILFRHHSLCMSFPDGQIWHLQRMSYWCSQGSHATWKTWNLSFSFAQKVVKTWNFNSKPGKNLKFANSIFQSSLFKMSFTKIILIYFIVIFYIINTNTDSKPNWPWISLLLPGDK